MVASILVLIVGALGLVIGSFLNVVIDRMPAGRSIMFPHSACASCGAHIRMRDNLPVISWMLLHARCRDCGSGIPARYPLVEFGTSVFFCVVAWWVGSASTGATSGNIRFAATLMMLAAFLYLAAVSVALALIDLDTHTLPNPIVLPAYLVAGILLAAAALLAGEPDRVLGSVLAGMALVGLYLLIALLVPQGMGFGDVKLAGLLGLYLGWIGWGAVAVGAVGAFVLGGVFGVLLILTRQANRRSSIAFGPWMLAASWLGIIGGNALAADYLSFFELS